MKKAFIPIVFLCLLVFIPDILFAGNVYVTAVKVNIRSGPGINFEVIASVRKNAALEKLDIKNNWTKVKIQNGQEGWIINNFISNTPTNPLEITLAEVKELLDEINKATGIKYLLSVVIKEDGKRLEVTVSDLWYDASEEHKERLVQVMAGGFAVSACRSGLRKKCDETDYPTISYIDEDGKQVAIKTTYELELIEDEVVDEGEEEEEEEEEEE